MSDLTTMTPAEIDEQLAGIAPRHAKAAADLEQAERMVKRHGYGAESVYGRRVAAGELLVAELAELMAPLHAEFRRRGGWTRAFIVAGGHVHSSTACSTCRITTRFGWLPAVSGLTEAEIVEQAGERACTVCYPSAPVNAGPSRLFHADELAAEADRATRAERSAELAAKRERNALNVDAVDAGGSVERIRTVTAGKAFLTDAFDTSWTHRMPADAELLKVAEALAAKLGTTAGGELEAARARGARRK